MNQEFRIIELLVNGVTRRYFVSAMAMPPVGCRACGGDWPNCTSSCPLYDE